MERLGLVPVLASFEVSVTMDDCASASFMFACPSCSVRSATVLTCLRPWCGTIALPWLDLLRHGYGLASFLPTWQRLPNFECLAVHNLRVVLAWTGPCFLETPAKNVV